MLTTSWIMGDRSTDKYIEKIDYVHRLKKVRLWYYSGDGDFCFPVEKTDVFLNIYVADNTDRARISTQATALHSILNKYPIGTYLVDFKEKKIVYDYKEDKELVTFNSIYLGKLKEIPFYIVCSMVDDKEKRKLFYLHSKFLKFSELVSTSSLMITPQNNIISEYGAGVFLRINQDLKLVGEVDPSVYTLGDFFNPQGVAFGGENTTFLEGFCAIVNSCFPTKKKDEDQKFLLSDIINSGEIPKNSNGKYVEVDIHPEGVNITSVIIRYNKLYVYVKGLCDLIGRSNPFLDYDFIIYMDSDTLTSYVPDLSNPFDKDYYMGD